MIEVECKYGVDQLEGLVRRLDELGAKWVDQVTQVDRYYAHPARDFATTDEALRIRSSGGQWCVTYKGPKLDSQTKTRREIELPLSGGDAGAEEFHELLLALGFRPVAEVRKRRREARLPWSGAVVTVAVDDVERVGSFVELELASTEEQVDAHRALITKLAAELGLRTSERRSYLELLLAS